MSQGEPPTVGEEEIFEWLICNYIMGKWATLCLTFRSDTDSVGSLHREVKEFFNTDWEQIRTTTEFPSELDTSIYDVELSEFEVAVDGSTLYVTTERMDCQAGWNR